MEYVILHRTLLRRLTHMSKWIWYATFGARAAADTAITAWTCIFLHRSQNKIQRYNPILLTERARELIHSICSTRNIIRSLISYSVNTCAITTYAPSSIHGTRSYLPPETSSVFVIATVITVRHVTICHLQTSLIWRPAVCRLPQHIHRVRREHAPPKACVP